MSEASIVAASSGGLQLSGVLDYRTGPQLREAGRRLIRASQESQLRIDCAGVEHSSSVGLSLLLAYLRDAGEVGKTLTMVNLPSEMHEIAKVSGILEILPLEG